MYIASYIPITTAKINDHSHDEEWKHLATFE